MKEIKNDDTTFTKLKSLDEEIRNAEKQCSELLLQKESHGQLDTGFPSKIPDDKLDEYNTKGFEQIKIDTGYIEEQATKFHDVLKEYFGGDYESIFTGESTTAKTILECINNETGVGVQHLSLLGSAEAEVLASSKYEVVEIVVENKYDYLTKHKEF